MTCAEYNQLTEYSIEEDALISTAIVETVSAVSNTPPQDLPPLFKVVDTDALDQLFLASENSVRMEVSYAGYFLKIDNKTIEVYQGDGEGK